MGMPPRETPLKIGHQKDFWSGVMFLCVGLGFAIGATNYNLGASARPGPGYFPLGLGALLACFGAVIALNALRPSDQKAEETRFGAVAWKPLLVIVASIAIFGATLPRLGLAISLPLLVLIISLAGDEFSWKGVVINALVLTIGSWAVFVYGLGLVIPVWPTFLGG